MMHTYLVFKNGKLVTVIQSTEGNVSKVSARSGRGGEILLMTDVDYIVEDPQDAEKQIAEWKSEHR